MPPPIPSTDRPKKWGESIMLFWMRRMLLGGHENVRWFLAFHLRKSVYWMCFLTGGGVRSHSNIFCHQNSVLSYHIISYHIISYHITILVTNAWHRGWEISGVFWNMIEPFEQSAASERISEWGIFEWPKATRVKWPKATKGRVWGGGVRSQWGRVWVLVFVFFSWPESICLTDFILCIFPL